MALSENTPQKYFSGDTGLYPVEASSEIFEGAAVGENGSGYAEPLTAGREFLGFSLQNIVGGAAAGDVNVLVRRKGALTLYISGLAITDIGKTVYASDDGTFTLTPGTATRIGRVIQWVETNYGVVEFGVVQPKASAYEIVAIGEAASTAEVNDIALTGVLATDVAFATLLVKGSTPRTILTTIAASGKITITFSGDPSTDHQVSYVVLRSIK
jgi:hypothetical protein